MGGCYESGDKLQQMAKRMVDARGADERFALLETTAAVPDDAKVVAANRCWLFREEIVAVNPETDDADALDDALRAALTNMLNGSAVAPPEGTAAALRYIRDRVNVPR